MTSRRDIAIAAFLGLATAAVRVPFAGRILYHWDSINFAYALQRFDVGHGQPHVPGYPLYVLLARAANLLLPDPQHALVALSIAGSGLAVGCLYLLGLRLFGRQVALGAAALFATSPLYWFYGEIALPHALDAFVVVSAVWMLWRVIAGEPAFLLPAAVWLGIAGGLRPQTQLFLLPLAAYAGWRTGVRRSIIALAVLALVDLLWFVPLVQLNGGLARYLELTREFYLAFNSTTSILSGGGLFGLRRNTIKLSMYTLYACGVGLPLALAGIAAEVRRHGTRRLRAAATDARAIVLALWVLPALAYYEFIHMGQQGLVFVFLPAFCLLSALAASSLASGAVAAVVLAAAANAAVFLFAPTFPLGGDRPKLLTVDTLRRHDESMLARLSAVRTHFDARRATVISAARRFPQYYLPEYALVSYQLGARWEVVEGQSLVGAERDLTAASLGLEPDANGFRYAVLFEEELEGFNAARKRIEWVDLPGVGRLAYLRLRPGEGLRLGPESFGIAPSPVAETSP